MPSTYTLIASNILSSTAASVTFSGLNSTYTDLVLRYAIRDSWAGGANGAQPRVTYNSVASGYSWTSVLGTGASAASTRASSQAYYETDYGSPSGTNTANTFSSGEIYIPNYAGSINKPTSIFSVGENNSTTAFLWANAVLWSNTAAITSITITANISTFVIGSSFFLYGIKNS